MTGATGFIGSHAAEKVLQDRSWSVIGTVHGEKGYKNTADLDRQRIFLVLRRFYNPDLLARDRGFPYRLIRTVKRRLLFIRSRASRIHLVSASLPAEMFIKVLKIDRLQDRVFIAADEGPVVLRNLASLIYSFYFTRNYPRFLRLPSVLSSMHLKHYAASPTTEHGLERASASP